MSKVIYMDVTINYMMQLGKEKELNIVLKDSVLKTFEKIVDGNFITVNYTITEDKDEKK